MNFEMNEKALMSTENLIPMIALSSLVFLMTACGDVDKNDGTVISGVELPEDSVLTLYCPDAGIASEPCVLDDPENPYAITPVLAPNPDDSDPDEEEGAAFKWALDRDAPSAKARFYLWATAQAMSPNGENQYHVALALQGMYSESGSELARDQAIKAYRSVLDNYFDDVWFFKYPQTPEPTEFLWPKKVRLLSIDNLWDVPADRGGIDPLYTSELAALEALGEWGYTFESGTGDVYRN